MIYSVFSFAGCHGTGELPGAPGAHLIRLKHLGEPDVTSVQVQVGNAALEAGTPGFDAVLDCSTLFLQGYATNV